MEFKGFWWINPIPYRGGCFSTTKPIWLNTVFFCLENMLFYYLPFHIPGLPNFWRKKEFEIFLGNPPFGPLKNLKLSEFSKLTPHDLIYHNVFIVESVSTIKIRMFAQNIEILPFLTLFFNCFWNSSENGRTVGNRVNMQWYGPFRVVFVSLESFLRLVIFKKNLLTIQSQDADSLFSAY